MKPSSTYDAARLFVAYAKANPQSELPEVSVATAFEVVVAAKIHHVLGSVLQSWIEERRQEWKGPHAGCYSHNSLICAERRHGDQLLRARYAAAVRGYRLGLSADQLQR